MKQGEKPDTTGRPAKAEAHKNRLPLSIVLRACPAIGGLLGRAAYREVAGSEWRGRRVVVERCLRAALRPTRKRVKSMGPENAAAAGRMHLERREFFINLRPGRLYAGSNARAERAEFSLVDESWLCSRRRAGKF